jgi:hypothetical protein
VSVERRWRDRERREREREREREVHTGRIRCKSRYSHPLGLFSETVIIF